MLTAHTIQCPGFDKSIAVPLLHLLGFMACYRENCVFLIIRISLI
jgi:hypothetical protein